MSGGGAGPVGPEAAGTTIKTEKVNPVTRPPTIGGRLKSLVEHWNGPRGTVGAPKDSTLGPEDAAAGAQVAQVEANHYDTLAELAAGNIPNALGSDIAAKIIEQRQEGLPNGSSEGVKKDDIPEIVGDAIARRSRSKEDYDKARDENGIGEARVVAEIKRIKRELAEERGSDNAEFSPEEDEGIRAIALGNLVESRTREALSLSKEGVGEAIQKADSVAGEGGQVKSIKFEEVKGQLGKAAESADNRAYMGLVMETVTVLATAREHRVRMERLANNPGELEIAIKQAIANRDGAGKDAAKKLSAQEELDELTALSDQVNGKRKQVSAIDERISEAQQRKGKAADPSEQSKIQEEIEGLEQSKAATEGKDPKIVQEAKEKEASIGAVLESQINHLRSKGVGETLLKFLQEKDIQDQVTKFLHKVENRGLLTLGISGSLLFALLTVIAETLKAMGDFKALG